MSDLENVQENVYAAPKADVEIVDKATVSGLAERKDRFFAAIIDAVVGLAVGVPFMLIAGPYLGFESFESQPGYKYLIPATIFGFVMFVVMHGYLLQKNGQTIGKKFLKIKILTTDDHKATLPRLLVLRYLPISIVTLIPLLGSFLPVVDALFIFRKDRRCLHDLIAGTKVVKCRN